MISAVIHALKDLMASWFGKKYILQMFVISIQVVYSKHNEVSHVESSSSIIKKIQTDRSATPRAKKLMFEVEAKPSVKNIQRIVMFDRKPKQ